MLNSKHQIKMKSTHVFHCPDNCFWFYNTDVMLTHTGGGAKPGALSAKMAGALLQFMKTGEMKGSWIQNDPDREARKSLPS
jgi:para-nitrobenzyl esterase